MRNEIKLTVDVVIFTMQDKVLKTLLVRRKYSPFQGVWAIPGGFVELNESLEDAAKRELLEETGVKNVYLEQLYSFGDVGRDPRGRIVTIAYYSLINSESLQLRADSDASEAMLFPVRKLPKLAFDHDKIINYALKRLKWKFEYTKIAFSILPKKFTLTQLQEIYEMIFSKEFDKRNFRKKILSLGILKEEKTLTEVSYRPPKLYSLKKAGDEIIEIIKPGA